MQKELEGIRLKLNFKNTLSHPLNLKGLEQGGMFRIWLMHKDSIGLFAKNSHNFSFFISEAGGDDSAAHLPSIIVAFQNRIVVAAVTQKCKVLIYCQLPGTEVKYRASKEDHFLHLSNRN